MSFTPSKTKRYFVEPGDEAFKTGRSDFVLWRNHLGRAALSI